MVWIVVDEYEITGAYIILNGEGEPNRHHAEAVKFAEEMGLPLKEFDMLEIRKAAYVNAVARDQATAVSLCPDDLEISMSKILGQAKYFNNPAKEVSSDS